MLKQYLQFKLSQKLSPQQIQFIKLLQVPTAELDTRIEKELEEPRGKENSSIEQQLGAGSVNGTQAHSSVSNRSPH